MAGFLPSFLSSAQLEIRIGETVLAYAQNLSAVDDMTTVPVGGIGAYSFHALEPVGYMARGSMTITHYSSVARKALTDDTMLPENMHGQSVKTDRDGNSLLTHDWFNPARLLISRTFDINVYERTITNSITTATTSRIIYALKDCRMTNLSFTFTPGSLVNQVASFMCLSIIDKTTEDTYKAT